MMLSENIDQEKLAEAALAILSLTSFGDMGGVHSYAVPGIIRQLNRMPMQAISYKFPIEALRSMFSLGV